MQKKSIVLKNPEFLKLYLAGLSSELGSFITDTALMLFIFAISDHNKAYIGITRSIFLFCFTAGSLIGGPLGVRFNKRNILIGSEVLRIPIILSLFFFHNLYFVLIANGLIGFFTGVYNPSRQTLINEIVPEKDIKEANSLFGTTMAVLHLIGPFMGATLYSYFHGIFQVLGIDLISYFLGILLLSKINFLYQNVHEKQQGEQSFKKDFIEGFSYLRSRPDLLTILVFTLVVGLCIGMLVPLLYPFVFEVLHKGEQAYGIVLSLFGLGGIIGGWFSSYLNKKFKASSLFIFGVVAEAAIMPLWIRTTHFTLNCLVIFVWGMMVFIRIPSQLNYLSANVPKEYMTRVYSFLDLVFVVPNISAGIIVAMVGNKLTTYEILNFTSILFILMVGAGLKTSGTKFLLAR
ncbi:MAG: MFS transporter [Bacteriovorax sp.]|jgi:predicted MFS family arabinose efflux permease|nr:MFS transporter [Bacteriovorax sp.]